MNSNARARLVVANDHKLFADACRRLLEPEFQVVALVTDGRALIDAALQWKPDLAIVDIAMPLLNGLDAAAQIKRRTPSIKFVFLAMNDDPELAAEAFRRGAAAYVLNPGTVAFHKYQMMFSLGVKSNAELLRYAINQELLCA